MTKSNKPSPKKRSVTPPDDEKTTKGEDTRIQQLLEKNKEETRALRKLLTALDREFQRQD